MPFLRWRHGAAIALLLALAGCATVPPPPAGPPPDMVRAEIERRLPVTLDDGAGWAADIQTAFGALAIAPTVENICAVLAVTEQESGYKADPPVANLPTIARVEIDRRAAAVHVPGFLVTAALKLRSSDAWRARRSPAS